jgi:hypothetical protein
MRYVVTIVALFVVGLLANESAAQAYVVYSPVAPAVYAAPAPVYTTAFYNPGYVNPGYVNPGYVNPGYVAPPVAHAAYYAPAPVAVAATPVYTTRYRPLLGGSITRVRYHYAPVAPVAYAAPPVAYAAPVAAPAPSCCY